RGVLAALDDAVRLLDADDPPGPLHRRQRRLGDRLPDGLDRVRVPLGLEDDDVGVDAAQHPPADRAGPAVVRAEDGRSEDPRRLLLAGTRRTGEQIGVARQARGGPERCSHPVLPDEAGPDLAHETGRSEATPRPMFAPKTVESAVFGGI